MTLPGKPDAAPRIEAVNDFVVKFANVNGSGSASANELFARSLLRMGVPVSPRNIFPSNIQGLPTWYEVRVSESGYLARRGGVDLMVAMNPQTWDKDLAEIEPGGYLLYDSSRPLPASKFRSDIVVLGVPLAIGHVTSAFANFVTIIGIPFSVQHLKLALCALAPVGKTVVTKDEAERARRRSYR